MRVRRRIAGLSLCIVSLWGVNCDGKAHAGIVLKTGERLVLSDGVHCIIHTDAGISCHEGT